MCCVSERAMGPSMALYMSDRSATSALVLFWETALMFAVSKRDNLNLTQQNLLLTSYDKTIDIYNNYNNKKTLTKSSTSNPPINQAPSPVKMSHPLHTPPSVPYPDPEPIDLDVLIPLEHEWTWWHDGMTRSRIFLDLSKN